MYKAEMVYNRNDARKFFIKGPKSSVRKFIDGFAIGIAVLMTIILMLALAGGAPLWAVAVTCIFFIVCFLPYYIYAFCIFYSNYISKPDKLLKEMLKYHETAVYKFFYYEFNVQFGKDKNIVNKSIEYTKLIYAVETPEYFFLYETRKNGSIIRKNAFTEGNPWDVSKVLQTHLGNKFTVKK